MSKIGIIIGREYWTRVKKKSFIIMTFLGPILMAALIIIPVYVAIKADSKTHTTIGVVDESGFYENVFTNNANVTFNYLDVGYEVAKEMNTSGAIPYLLYIPESKDGKYPDEAFIYGHESVNNVTTTHIKSLMSSTIRNAKLNDAGIDVDILNKIKSDVKINSYKTDIQGNIERSYNEISEIIGYIVGMIIYFAIYMFASQVMRGIMEEKSSRIVEVMISSVKPFELMMGKIIGIGLVGLTQFLLWIVLTSAIVFSVSGNMINNMPESTVYEQTIQSMVPTGTAETIIATDVVENQDKIAEVINMVSSINIPLLLICFLVYFVGGYLLYSSLFAAVGGAVDNEDDTNQFMLPLTLFLVIPLLFLTNLINDPSGSIAMWLSMIPFTSPIAMMVRIPFDIPTWQILLSMAILIVTFILMTWLSAKIYRVGILMYGKKITWKELWKWIKIS